MTGAAAQPTPYGSRPCTVYFIAPVGGGPIKIGCSQSPVARLQSLSTWSFVPLKILAAAPGCANDERKIHSMFADSHSHGEWFHPTQPLIDMIARINATGELPAECRGVEGQKGCRVVSAKTRAKQSAAMKRAWAMARPSVVTTQ